MDPFLTQLKDRIDDRAALERKLQMLLVAQWRQQRRDGERLTLKDVEFRTFSQNGEDGALLYIFSLIGTTNRTVVEICAGNGVECNAANLLINHGWKGLLVDGSERNANFARDMYNLFSDTWVRPPVVACSWVTAENVNDLIASHGFRGEIDLFSLDIDGMDYWVWKALTIIQPRVVVLEYNWAWKAEHAVTVPYDPQFALDFSRTPYYCGASLAAFAKLGRALGYRYVGSLRTEINAFFVRNDLGVDVLPEQDLRTGLHYALDYDWGDRPWLAV